MVLTDVAVILTSWVSNTAATLSPHLSQGLIIYTPGLGNHDVSRLTLTRLMPRPYHYAQLHWGSLKTQTVLNIKGTADQCFLNIINLDPI